MASKTIHEDKADEIIERIMDGDSMTQIAKDIGASKTSLLRFLTSEALADRSARAKEESAEAWLDKGLEAIEAAMRKDSGLDSNAARAYAQECARRAAIRNPRYNERLSVDLTAKVNTNAQLTEAELMEIAARGKNPGGDVQKG